MIYTASSEAIRVLPLILAYAILLWPFVSQQCPAKICFAADLPRGGEIMKVSRQFKLKSAFSSRKNI